MHHGGGTRCDSTRCGCAPAVSNAHPPHSLVKRLADLSKARHRQLLMRQQEGGGGVGGAGAWRTCEDVPTLKLATRLEMSTVLSSRRVE